MISYIFREAGSNGPLGAGDYYKLALDAIAARNEGETAMYLKAARNALLGGRHWNTLSDADVQKIMPDLTVDKFNGLFGDTMTECATSDWLTESQTSMVRRHRNQLGPNPLSNVA